MVVLGVVHVNDTEDDLRVIRSITT